MKKNLVMKIIIGFIAGLIVGVALWLSKVNVSGYLKVVSPFGNVLVSMLKMVVVPVIFLSLVTGAASLPTGKFGKIGLKVIIWYFATSLIAAVVGSFLATIFSPGSSNIGMWQQLITTQTAVDEVTVTTTGALTEVFLNMFKNPFESLASGNFLAIIVFAIAFGLALKLNVDNPKTSKESKEKIHLFLNLFETAQEGVFTIVDWVLAYSPIGVFALTSCNFANYGSALFGPYVSLTLGVILGILFMIFVVYPLMIVLFVHKNPYKLLFKIKEAPLTAFVTRSSAATLPVSLKVAEDEINVDSSLSAFALPLGATINMDGVCVHLPFFAVLAANMFGVQLGFAGLTILVITTVLASIGAGGVPGGSLMLLFIILQNMGLQPSQIAIIVGLALGINPILDMFETMNNVTGDIVCTYAVAENSDMIVNKE